MWPLRPPHENDEMSKKFMCGGSQRTKQSKHTRTQDDIERTSTSIRKPRACMHIQAHTRRGIRGIVFPCGRRNLKQNRIINELQEFREFISSASHQIRGPFFFHPAIITHHQITSIKSHTHTHTQITGDPPPSSRHTGRKTTHATMSSAAPSSTTNEG
jgi:hypothetical protein